LELRASLAPSFEGDEGVVKERASSSCALAAPISGTTAAARDDILGQELLDRVEQSVSRLSGFVVEHQDSFKKVWGKECRLMIQAATVFLWVACVLAIGITAGMFWLFLENHMQGAHASASTHFASATLCGLLAPAFYALSAGGFCCQARDVKASAEDFQDCIEVPPSLEAHRRAQIVAARPGGRAQATAQTDEMSPKDRKPGNTGLESLSVGLLDVHELGAMNSDEPNDDSQSASTADTTRVRGALRLASQALRLPLSMWPARRWQSQQPEGRSAREPFASHAWPLMDDDGPSIVDTGSGGSTAAFAPEDKRIERGQCFGPVAGCAAREEERAISAPYMDVELEDS